MALYQALAYPGAVPGVWVSTNLPAASNYPIGTSIQCSDLNGGAGGTLYANGAGWQASVPFIGNTAPLSVVNALRSTIAEAASSNPVTTQPLIAPAAWVLSTAYKNGESVSNGGNAYLCCVSGTSAASGGPTGTGNALIVDGGVTWVYWGPTFTSNANAPTVTVITNNTPTYTGNFWANTTSIFAVASAAARISDTSNFLITGGPYAENFGGNKILNQLYTTPPFTGSLVNQTICVDFMTDCASIQVLIYANNSANARTSVFINGVPLYLGQVPGVPGNGTNFCMPIQIAFGSKAVRRVTVEGQFAFYGVVCTDATSKVWAAPRTSMIRAAVVGDSFLAPPYETTPSLTLGPQLCKLLGIQDFASSFLGSGSGYTAAGTFGSFMTNLGLMTQYNPNLVFVYGGINDSANSAAVEQTAVLAYLQAVRAALPNALIIVYGCEAGSTGPGAGEFTIEAAISAAVTQFNDSACFFIPQSYTTAEKAWISGTGNVGATTGSGNADVYNSGNGPHPIQGGVNYLAQQCANGVINLVSSLLATGVA